MTDREIMQLYINRDEKAVQVTKEEYGKCLYFIAFNILHNKEDAEEVLNDTYLAAWENAASANPERLLPYLAGTVRNLAVSRLRESNAAKRGRSVTFAAEELDDCIRDENIIENELTDRLLSESLNRFLLSLPDAEKTVFVLRYWGGYDIKAIAKQCGKTQGGVKMMLSRTRKKLKSHLIKDGLYDE